MELVPVIVLIVQGFRFISGQTCMEIPKCQYDEKKFADAQSQGDMNTICPLLTNTVICKAIALNDCKGNPSYKDSALEPIQQGLDRDNEQRLAICGAVPEDAECEDIIKCSLETPMIHQYVTASMIEEACGLYQRSVQCLRSSIEDCKERKILQSGYNETQLEKSEDFLKQNCAHRKQALEREPHESNQVENPGVVVAISSALLTAALLVGHLLSKRNNNEQRHLSYPQNCHNYRPNSSSFTQVISTPEMLTDKPSIIAAQNQSTHPLN